MSGDDLLRDAIWSARHKREEARLMRLEASNDLYLAVSEAQGHLTVTEIARLGGISRRAVYDLFATIERDQG